MSCRDRAEQAADGLSKSATELIVSDSAFAADPTRRAGVRGAARETPRCRPPAFEFSSDLPPALADQPPVPDNHSTPAPRVDKKRMDVVPTAGVSHALMLMREARDGSKSPSTGGLSARPSSACTNTSSRQDRLHSSRGGTALPSTARLPPPRDPVASKVQPLHSQGAVVALAPPATIAPQETGSPGQDEGGPPACRIEVETSSSAAAPDVHDSYARLTQGEETPNVLGVDEWWQSCQDPDDHRVLEEYVGYCWAPVSNLIMTYLVGEGAFRSLFLYFGFGFVAYRAMEGWTLFETIYFLMVTATTVGYGDFVPVTLSGKLFTIIYSVVGISVVRTRPNGSALLA